MNQFIKTFIISILIVFGIKSTYAVFNTDTVIEVDRKNEIGLSGHLRFYRNMKPSGVNSMFYFRHPLSSHAYVGAGYIVLIHSITSQHYHLDYYIVSYYI